MHAEIIAIGTELLLAGRLDTNSIFLAERLAGLGIETRFKTAVGDDCRDIAQAIRTAATRSDVVLLTGGLGPTVDDCTREAVAAVTGRSLLRHAEALAAIRRRLAEWRRSPSPAQLRQALIPRGAVVLDNPIGSAPGFMLAWRKRYVAALPGVPSEARAMFEQAVVPRLLEVHPGGRPLVFHQLQTFGVPEADVDARVADLFRRRGNLRYGLLAAPLGVTITLTMLGHATGRHESRPSRAFARVVDAIRERLADSLYAEGEETMESVVGRELEARGLMLAVAESCTGGLIGHRLTQVPGSSAYVDRGVIVYSNEAKQDLLGVPAGTLRRHGAVSAETAAAMARGMRTRSRADVALSVTGIAGPGGGTDRKPVGLVYIGLDARPGNGKRKPVAATREHRFHGPREVVKLRASQAALDLLRRWLQGHRLQP